MCASLLLYEFESSLEPELLDVKRCATLLLYVSESSLELDELLVPLDGLEERVKIQVVELGLDDALKLWWYELSFECEVVDDMLELMHVMCVLYVTNEIHGLSDVHLHCLAWSGQFLESELLQLLSYYIYYNFNKLTVIAYFK